MVLVSRSMFDIRIATLGEEVYDNSNIFKNILCCCLCVCVVFFSRKYSPLIIASNEDLICFSSKRD